MTRLEEIIRINPERIDQGDMIYVVEEYIRIRKGVQVIIRPAGIQAGGSSVNVDILQYRREILKLHYTYEYARVWLLNHFNKEAA